MGTIDLSKKEYEITLTTGTDINIDNVSGKLNSIIIDSKETISITIESSLGYLIFHNSQHVGARYYAPRAVLQGSQENIVVQDQFDKFKLNESLNILVHGPTNAEVNIIIRID